MKPKLSERGKEMEKGNFEVGENTMVANTDGGYTVTVFHEYEAGIAECNGKGVAYILLVNAIISLFDYAEQSGEGYPLNIPLEMVDALREKLEESLLP